MFREVDDFKMLFHILDIIHSDMDNDEFNPLLLIEGANGRGVCFADLKGFRVAHYVKMLRDAGKITGGTCFVNETDEVEFIDRPMLTLDGLMLWNRLK